jgi:uncharacterized protein YndB with AHSA1/START domain
MPQRYAEDLTLSKRCWKNFPCILPRAADVADTQRRFFSSFPRLLMPLSAIRSKHRFVQEYPINASAKILYPYLASASGLRQWFCQDVQMINAHTFEFTWDNQRHLAEMTSHRTNRSVRYVFLSPEGGHVPDANYLDFSIESSELTQEIYLRVADYSEETDDVELQEMWDNLLQNLRELIGG